MSDQVPTKDYTFAPSDRYINDAMFDDIGSLIGTLHQWVNLSAGTSPFHSHLAALTIPPDGRGMLHIDDPDRYNLAPPYKMPVTDNSRILDVHFVSVFHQLHCLVSLPSQSVLGASIADGQPQKSIIIEAFYHARAGPPGIPGSVTHQVHCFEYLRQSIMCSADTSLEGYTGMGNGWGSIHRCTDYDALLDWMNERTVLPFNNKPPSIVI
jgi:hypothetical protein